MAFIVEMFWGRPHHLIVYGLDSDGELVPQRVIESEDPPDPERRTFSCSHWTWYEALELGRNHGWIPKGTVPEEDSRKNWEKDGNYSPDYDPVDWGYIKTVVKEDAAAWADALEIALHKAQNNEIALDTKAAPTIFGSGMTPGEFHSANRGATEDFLAEFIQFLRKGQFNFTYDD